jgi:hypothetical protein
MAVQSLTVAAAAVIIALPALTHQYVPEGTPPLTDNDPRVASCYTTGTNICPEREDQRDHAWNVFAARNGSASLKVDPSRHYEIYFTGTAVRTPVLTDNQTKLVGTDGTWYVFSIEYTD